MAFHNALWTNDDAAGGWPPARQQVVGVDFTFEMLPLAIRKSSVPPPPGIDEPPSMHGFAYLNADAMRLPFPDESFNVVSIAFGLRNVADPDAAVAEFVRVLRPGGRLVVLEFSTPHNPLLRWASRLYTEHVMPRTATWIADDKSGAYKYLPRSVATFAEGAQMVELFQGHGLVNTNLRALNFGIATCYVAERA